MPSKSSRSTRHGGAISVLALLTGASPLLGAGLVALILAGSGIALALAGRARARRT